MSDRVVLAIPVEGRVVRCPITKQPLPPEGKLVVLEGYWIRRLMGGDITVSEETR